MVARRLGSLLVIRQNKHDATEQDWDDFIKYLTLHRQELDRLRILVYTDGGIPTAAQRKRLAQTLAGVDMLVAAVSDDIKVRFSGATIALFQRYYRQFAVSEMSRAYEHLRMTPGERREVELAFEDLERQLSTD